MPRERLSMRKVREVLRLKYEQKLSNRAIASSCRLSVGSVHDYLQRARVAGLSWPLPDGLSDEALDLRLFPLAGSFPSDRAVPEWERVVRELRRKAVTLSLLWEQYRSDHPSGYGYSRFCELFQSYASTIDPRMRLVHKAGEKLFVDYAGATVPIYGATCEEAYRAAIFVGALGASGYAYAEATRTASLPDWLGSHVRMLTFYGHAPTILVPDNPRVGVTKADRYEPELQRSYEEMAAHYSIAVIPARPHRPKDKPKAELTVLLVCRWVLARLRHQRFFSLEELNAAIRPLLIELNERPFQKLPGSRRSVFEALDRPAMRPLPATPYVYAEWKRVRAAFDYHVDVDRHYYSVPHPLVGQELWSRFSAATVEVFHRSVRVASHVRSYQHGVHTTLPQHMPRAHLNRCHSTEAHRNRACN